MVRITVFTPTYNRAYTLPRLYESLKAQTFQDFEWVIVDDGSVDNTTEVVNEFIQELPFFEIKYRKTENGGKHRAINRGIDLVTGELFLIMDSDDWLRADALELIDRVEKGIPQDQKFQFAGVYGLKCHQDGSMIGSTFVGDTLDITYFEREKYGISGDKAEVYYSQYIRKFPFPEYEGEQFCTECLVWDQIAALGLKLRHFNECIYFCEYLSDGLTHNEKKLYANNPRQYGQYVRNIYIYKKQNRFHSMIKIYEYYLYEREKMPFRQIVESLGLGMRIVVLALLVQSTFDVVRAVLHHGNTVRASVDRGKNEEH